MTSPDTTRRSRRGRPFTPEERQEITAHVAARVAMGERLDDILGRDGLPAKNSFVDWMRKDPRLAKGYRAARASNPKRWWTPGRPGVYSQALGEAICARICEAQGLDAICAEPGMPSQATVYRWLAQNAEFAAAYGMARKVQADRLFDETRRIAEASTNKSWRRDKLLIDTLRWQVAKLAPRRYGPRPEAEGEARDERPQLNIVLRNFADDLAGDSSRDQVICRDGVYLERQGDPRHRPGPEPSSPDRAT